MVHHGKKEEWSLKLARPPGNILAKGIAKLPVKILPNHVTMVSLLFMIIAAIGFFYGNIWLVLGGILYYVGLVFDCADGTLARLTNTSSKFGERLDFYCDTVGNIFLYFGLWYSQYYLLGNWFIGGAIIVAHYAVMAFGYMFLKSIEYKTIFPKIGSYYGPADEGLITFCFLPIIAFFIPGAFQIVFPILVILQFISYLILFAIQKERPDVIKNIKTILKL
jgi:phosphatidylglycerophosphate synthase